MIETTKLRRVLRIWITALALIEAASAANAAPILTPTGGDIDANILVLLTEDLVPVYEARPAETFFDVRGSADVEATESSTGVALGAGQLIGDGPVDIALEIFQQADTLTLATSVGTRPESLRLTFDFAGSSLTPADPAPFGASWFVPVLGTPIGPVTDPFLLGFLGNNIAELQLTSVEVVNEQVTSDSIRIAAHNFELLSIQNLAAADISEPSMFGVIAIGLAMVCSRRRDGSARG